MPKTGQDGDARRARLDQKYGKPGAWNTRGVQVDGGTVSQESTLGVKWVRKNANLGLKHHRTSQEIDRDMTRTLRETQAAIKARKG